jgi:hypothetical protein
VPSSTLSWLPSELGAELGGGVGGGDMAPPPNTPVTQKHTLYKCMVRDIARGRRLMAET